MKKLLRLALLLAVVLPFAVLQAGPKADADLAAIADHFTKTSAACHVPRHMITPI